MTTPDPPARPGALAKSPPPPPPVLAVPSSPLYNPGVDCLAPSPPPPGPPTP